MAKFVLEQGADARTTDLAGTSPLRWLCMIPSEGMNEIAESLIEAGANPNATEPVVSKSQYGLVVEPNKTCQRWTPLHWAAMIQSLPAVDALLKAGSDPDLKLFDGPQNTGDRVTLSPLELDAPCATQRLSRGCLKSLQLYKH